MVKFKGQLVGKVITLESEPVNLPYEVEVSLKPFKSNRSNSQNNYYWGEVIPKASLGFSEAWGQNLTSELTHETLKSMFLGRDIENRETGEVVRITRSTSKLNSKEMTDYIEQIRSWAFHFCQITINQAGEKW